ncbi:hypothetical protein ACT3HK_11850 [Thermolongibacillus altinsuensis]
MSNYYFEEIKELEEEIEKLEEEVKNWRQLVVDFISENGLNQQFFNWLQEKNTNGDLDKYIGWLIVLLSEKEDSDAIIN